MHDYGIDYGIATIHGKNSGVGMFLELGAEPIATNIYINILQGYS